MYAENPDGVKDDLFLATIAASHIIAFELFLSPSKKETGVTRPHRVLVEEVDRDQSGLGFQGQLYEPKPARKRGLSGLEIGNLSSALRSCGNGEGW